MNFTIKDRKIKADNSYLIGYNSDYIAHFTFDEEWEGTIKTARFYQDDGYYDVIIDDNNTCILPPLLKGKLRIGVFNSSMTTTYTTLWVDASIKDEHGDPIEPSEDVYAQLIALIESGMLKGSDGVGIDSIIQTVVSTESDGENIFTVTLTDGSSSDIKIKNGSKGDKGETGYTPIKGIDYFDGEKGEPGNDGYTPQKGIDYFDGKDGAPGYTPQKNIDYFDGIDGYTPQKGIDYFTDSEISAFKEDITPKKGVDYFDGTDGKDGKDGETGPQGPKGDTGEQGPAGIDGEDGYTPVKGVDYFTDDEIAAFKAEVTPKKGIDYTDGEDGYTPQKGIDYFDGKDGQNGSDGSDGYTPIKGVDYFTESEIESFKSDVTPQKGIDYFDGQNGQDGYTPQKGVDYFDGENGYTPVKGVDYFTAEEIAEIEQNAANKVDVSDKLTQPIAASVGQIFKVQSINEDGSLVLEAVDMPTVNVDDVQVNGTSIVTDGIANIPKGSGSVLGVFKVNAGAGIEVGSSGDLRVKSANADTISKRNTSYQPITPSLLDIAVKYAMTDGKGAEWTDAEKTGAWKRLNSIKTAMDEIAVAGAQYYLGEQTAVGIVLPDDAQIGQMVTVSWYNGATPANLSITGTMLAFDYTPSANTRSEINALWDGRYWAVIGNEMEVPNE